MLRRKSDYSVFKLQCQLFPCLWSLAVEWAKDFKRGIFGKVQQRGAEAFNGPSGSGSRWYSNLIRLAFDAVAVISGDMDARDRKSTRLNSSHYSRSRMPSSA